MFGTAVHAVLTSRTVDQGSLISSLKADGLLIDGVAPVEPSLEDVFLDVVEKSA